MAPFQGAGAGQAIEVSKSVRGPRRVNRLMNLFSAVYQDASILASLLSHDLTTRATASHVLGIYSRVRQPLATEVARRSRLNGEHFSLRGLTGPDVSSTRLLPGILKQIQDNFEWVSETDAAIDLQRAMALLRAELMT